LVRNAGETLQGRAITRFGGAQKERDRVEMIRSLPMRVYLAYTELRDREDGQALVEYALLLALIAIVSIGILTTLGGSVSQVFSKINSKMP
jgi:pilus assembly protein Flp/PilA